VKPTFQGEVQFAGYADGSRGGPRVTLRLADRDELDKFIGMEGKRFMAVLVEIADDETPAEPEKPAPAKERVQRERMGPLCEWAVYRCGEPAFKDWASHQSQAGGGQGKFTSMEAEARGVILALCGVTSRRELDTNPEAAKRFHERVRVPYSAWLAKRHEFQQVPA